METEIINYDLFITQVVLVVGALFFMLMLFYTLALDKKLKRFNNYLTYKKLHDDFQEYESMRDILFKE